MDIVTSCCSTFCDKRHICKRQYVDGLCNDYYSYGSGGIGRPVHYWCGPQGNYGMFIPIDRDKIIEEFNKVIKMSEDIGYPIKLYPESEISLRIYYNEDRNMLLVDKYLCR